MKHKLARIIKTSFHCLGYGVVIAISLGTFGLFSLELGIIFTNSHDSLICFCVGSSITISSGILIAVLIYTYKWAEKNS